MKKDRDLLEYCRKRGLSLDRETYLAGCYPDGVPDLSPEEEEEELVPAWFPVVIEGGKSPFTKPTDRPRRRR